jgi:hypothetical protein
MGIIGNIQNNIVVICEIKSFYITLAAGKFFPNNIHGANYYFTHNKKLKKPRWFFQYRSVHPSLSCGSYCFTIRASQLQHTCVGRAEACVSREKLRRPCVSLAASITPRYSCIPVCSLSPPTTPPLAKTTAPAPLLGEAAAPAPPFPELMMALNSNLRRHPSVQRRATKTFSLLHIFPAFWWSYTKKIMFS